MENYYERRPGTRDARFYDTHSNIGYVVTHVIRPADADWGPAEDAFAPAERPAEPDTGSTEQYNA